MYQLTKFGVVILTAAALSCWPAPVLAGPTVPYKDHASGTAEVIGVIHPGPPPILEIRIHGFGEGTHLGHFEFTGTHILNFQTMEVEDGEFTFTAADGSTISGIYFGPFTQTAPDVRRNDLTVLILEGTDRLAGVTGIVQTVVIVVGTGPTFDFTWTSEGFLTFPNGPQK
jgi:hypothetical protein